MSGILKKVITQEEAINAVLTEVGKHVDRQLANRSTNNKPKRKDFWSFFRPAVPAPVVDDKHALKKKMR